MKILIIGGAGMFGHKLVQVLSAKYEVFATFRSEFASYKKYGVFDRTKVFENVNVENLSAVQKVLTVARPDVIINAVGIIKQVSSANNVVETLNVNSIFPHRLAELAAGSGARLINVSTDCVFSGAQGFYRETDVADAIDLYGRSKNLGEVVGENCLTVRTSIIGRELNTAHSLLEWFLSSEGKTVRGYRKAIFSGFPTVVLAEIFADLIENHPHLEGLYHVSSAPINKFDLLELIKTAYDADIRVEPFDDFEIDRSLNSEKFRQATGFKPLPWKQMIELMAEDDLPYRNRRR